MPKISAIIIVRNEEEMLARCLGSMKWADQVIVVDSGSTDRTVEIARAAGAEVHVEEWKGYGAQKNSALDKATGEWVVSLDADEEFTVEAQADIQRICASPDPSIQGYAFRRKVFYLGKWIRHGDWYPDHVVRLWKRGMGRFSVGRVHESVTMDGAVELLKSEILHYTYRDVEDQWQRIQKYADLWARDRHESGRKAGLMDHGLRPPLRFLRALILKGGILDGWRGILIAWMSAREVRLKYQILGRLNREGEGRTSGQG